MATVLATEVIGESPFIIFISTRCNNKFTHFYCVDVLIGIRERICISGTRGIFFASRFLSLVPRYRGTVGTGIPVRTFTRPILSGYLTKINETRIVKLR